MSPNGKALVLILAVVLGAFPAAAAHSTSLYVGDGSGATLNKTIASAQAGDTIIVGPGTYTVLEGFMVGRPLHIISEKGPSETIIANYGRCIGVGGPCYGSLGFSIGGFNGSFTIKGFTIRDTHKGQDGFDGQGIDVYRCSGTISDNVFVNDEGGIIVYECPGLVIEGNLIQGSGTGISISSPSSPTTAEIRYNTLVLNYAHISIGWGLAYPQAQMNVVVRNNIMASSSWWALRVQGSTITASLSCNDFWNNAAGDCYGLSSGCVGSDGNIAADPLFCSGYYLHQGSPCLGANTPTPCNGEPMGCYPVACEVAVQGKSWGNIKSIFK
jgi:hypothetical protein